jgi:hypothetical protein
MPKGVFLQKPPLLTVCRQISREASEYLDQYIVVELWSKYSELSSLIDPEYPDDIYFTELLALMRARASRFSNVIELEPPEIVVDDMLFTVREEIITPWGHVGVTGAYFPKLTKLVWWGGREVNWETRRTREAAAKYCFDKPDLEVECLNYVWSDSDERDRSSDEDEVASSNHDEMASSDDDEMASSDDDEMASSNEDKIATSDEDKVASPDDGEMASLNDYKMASADYDDDMASFGDDEMDSPDDEEDLP